MCDRPLPGCSSRACSHEPEEERHRKTAYVTTKIIRRYQPLRFRSEAHRRYLHQLLGGPSCRRSSEEPDARNEVPAMTSNRTILITGVTGNQGGAVAQALQGAGFHLRGLTRKPDSERAAALARHGVDIVKGDLDDEATLRRALAGAWGVFGVQNAGGAGVEREEAQGKRLATLARE